ncbi:MAG TPA: serine hydrolase [Gaiellaceae bacterium]|nr:serine hydrolase [Gaiellaceae bacterium]
MASAPERGSSAAPATAAELGLMQGSPPEPSRLVTVAGWQEGPWNRWAFQHVSELVPCAVVPRGTGPVFPLPSEPEELGSTPLGGVGCADTLDDFLHESYTDGFLVLRDGRILYERYENGMRPASRHVLMSVSKSLCGVLTGGFVESGALDPDATVATYVPELWDSAYGDATISQLLDMTVSLEFNEDYADPDSEVQAQDRVAGWRPRRLEDPETSYDFLRSLRRKDEHGRAFQYCSATTDVLAWVLERVTGRRYPEVLADGLWSRIGAEHDAFVTVDRVGFAFANGGVCASLRDLARLGHLVLRGGSADAHRVCSPQWAARIREGSDPGLMAGSDFARAYPDGSYRSQWWSTGGEASAFYAVGIFGQFIWVDPGADVVIVKLSSLPKALDPVVTRDHHRAFRSVAAALA